MDQTARYKGTGNSYLAEAGLAAAVNVARLLGRPLLVTGEPGTGKTRLSYSVAEELGLLGPLVFVVKTTSVGKDLLYHYDALGHYGAVLMAARQESGAAADAKHYIRFDALGCAIAVSNPTISDARYLPEELRAKGPAQAVVLVDEIDKAPRDFPNDLLDEFENFRFLITETGETFTGKSDLRPLIVITSNSEKNLPDAFLRRCVYYNLSPPNPDRLAEILALHLGSHQFYSDDRIKSIVAHFSAIRELALTKKPATAELLDWATLLMKMEVDPNVPGHTELIVGTYSVLAKTKSDLELLRARIGA